MRSPSGLVSLSLALLLGCGSAPASAPSASAAPASSTHAKQAATRSETVRDEVVTLSIVGTNDVHGRVFSLPIFGGFVRNLRAVRESDGAVLLIDAGDTFQGTLESNLNEGAAMVRAYNVLGYTAAAIGNHEFDFGPVGAAATPERPEDDPRGALLARAAEAQYAVLSANIEDTSTGQRVAWPNVAPSALITAAGIQIGIVGVSTIDTPTATIAANVVGIRFTPLVDAIREQAAALRARGAKIVIVTAHAGGKCEAFEDAGNVESCDPHQEIFEVARALPEGTVDVIVAGHTHSGVAHRVGGTAIIESFAYGRAFGRVDLRVERRSGRVVEKVIHPPQFLCGEAHRDDEVCEPGTYEGRSVEPDPAITEAIAPDVEQARLQRERRLGARLADRFWRSHDVESPLGNLFAKVMLENHPRADAALINSGALRTDLQARELTYGELYECLPFDNRLATVRLRGSDLANLIARNMQSERGIVSMAGARAQVRCANGQMQVDLYRANGRRIRPNEELTVLTSDFLVTGGDGLFGEITERADAVRMLDGPPIRDLVARYLERRGGSVAMREFYRSDRAILQFQGERPLRCEASAAAE